MELKKYQEVALDTLDKFLVELAKQRDRALAIEDAIRTQPAFAGMKAPDYPTEAWNAIQASKLLPPSRAALSYSPRSDGLGRTVPNVCLKVPTGGGKTLLAVGAVSRIFGQYVRANTGFVLWVVPNEAIYEQTKRQLADRDHPYRQLLDKAGAGRVKLLEKEDSLDSKDIKTHLCVMLLMLQSANRESKETLRIFRDRGNVTGFLPAVDDVLAHHSLMSQIPNLTAYSNQDTSQIGSIIQESLGNILRIMRPVVVMDEGHRAYSAGAIDTLYGFNPSFLLELSATPKDRPPLHANWLVDVRGTDLAAEEMIKLPINVKVKGGTDWRNCLIDGLDTLNRLKELSAKLHANTQRYIRPIMLVQVERTGKEQRGTSHIHADDVRDYLLTVGLTAAEIAVKTSEVNDLKQPENLNLMSPHNEVRVIITKQALQEGWDCPFAYVLCSLAANKNLSAMTQLVGRVLRQPDATKTDIAELDECYVVCLHKSTKDVVDGIKKGLEQDGMADLSIQVNQGGGSAAASAKARTVQRRKAYQKTHIALPVVNWVQGKAVRPLDYERDILLRIEWSKITLKALASRMPTQAHQSQTRVTRLTIAGSTHDDLLKEQVASTATEIEDGPFDTVFATRAISDIVPNPWVARALIGNFIDELVSRGLREDALGAMAAYLLEELRQELLSERDRLAEALFMKEVAQGHIQFRLKADEHNWQMPSEITTDRPTAAPPLTRPSDAALVEKSVFWPVYREDFNGDEAEFACYLDERSALEWWHRNVARPGNYAVQGWRKHRVYPDFLFSIQTVGKAPRVLVWEMKGDQLDGNLDTTYKRKLLSVMTANFKRENATVAGSLKLKRKNDTEVELALVLMSEWKSKIGVQLTDLPIRPTAAKKTAQRNKKRPSS